MNEVKQPKKPLLYYWSIVMLVLIIFNFLAMPKLFEQQVVETDYGTFLTMVEKKGDWPGTDPGKSDRIYR